MSISSSFKRLQRKALFVETLSFRNTALVLIAINITSVLAINLRNISIAEFISIEAFGQITILTSYTAILITIFSLGWPQLIIRNIAHDRENTAQISLAILSTQSFLFVFCLFSYLLLSALGAKLPLVALLAYPAAALGILAHILLSAIEGYRKVIWSRLAQSVLRPFLTLGLIISIYSAFNVKPLLSFVFSQFIFLLLVGIILAFVVISQTPRPKIGFREFFASPKTGIRPENIWILVIAGFNTLLISEDILILQFFVGDNEIGQYGILTSVVTIIAVGMSAVNAIFIPDFAKTIKEKSNQEAKTLFFHAQRISTVWSFIAVGMLLAVFAAAPEWMALTDSISLLAVLFFLALGKMSSAMTGPCTNVMFVYGRTSLIAYSVIVACVLNFVGNLLLIPVYGLLGAAISTGLSISAINVWQLLFIKKNFGF